MGGGPIRFICSVMHGGSTFGRAHSHPCRLHRLNRTRVLVYSGDVDVQIPHAGTEAWTRGLGLPVAEAWRPWLLEEGGAPAGSIVSYATPVEGTSFAFLTVRGAGHEVPAFRPRAAFAFISRFLRSERI